MVQWVSHVLHSLRNGCLLNSARVIEDVDDSISLDKNVFLPSHILMFWYREIENGAASGRAEEAIKSPLPTMFLLRHLGWGDSA